MASKSLLDECAEHLCVWGMLVCLGAFAAATFGPYVTGSEFTNLAAFCGGLLFERCLASFAFVYDWTHQNPVKIGG